MNNIIVIGGGAAGMMASLIAAKEGKKVILIEKNEKLGKKVYITGKGRCNITTSLEIEEIMSNIPGNSSFLYSALYTFSNHDLMNMIEDMGVKLKIERGNRVFPESDKSSDIIKAFENHLKKHDVNIMFNSEVSDIIIVNNEIKGVILNNRELPCDSVIIATGGMSYPLTGSTGDGYKFAKKAGHTVTKIRPSLIPLTAKEEWVKKLQGLSLKNASVNVSFKNKVIFEQLGEMIFTHFGVSGPIILSASRFVVDRLPDEVKLSINLKPGLTFEQLDKRVQKDFEIYSNKMFKNSLDSLLPQKMIPVIIELSGIHENKEVNQITRDERISLVKLLQNLTLTITCTRPIKEAIVTAGGVSVKEINPSTMESKIVKGLYFAGEVIDVDGLTGGFNLQIAFSTGYCAGLNA
ncbi:tRNA uridine 5-carboxymethylaminomethyl modification enzyme MnmG [Oxobacter pfennigii]|uniref:tRNA uridine 5-carboxymethylaminomethyl modification enzyme MnmG n=1 Tax=Oxobacter pfennigii TaxID=36849 RepID=A0A0P8X222_9CLOT|nr:NAD(P)/FAD-dependent oxidoreductase [Oxobacter pfennigii]KPU44859.1 tRNA uridine 5-carboxymethylaminomethyl modification enzyme MnmG [Oxobacter pfennigii]